MVFVRNQWRLRSSLNVSITLDLDKQFTWLRYGTRAMIRLNIIYVIILHAVGASGVGRKVSVVYNKLYEVPPNCLFDQTAAVAQWCWNEATSENLFR